MMHFASRTYFERLEKRLEERFGNFGAIPRYASNEAINYSPRYLAKLDCLGLGPPSFKRGNRVFYPIPELIGWLKARTR